ncbi:hypothetical protein ACFL1G_02845 [Planctomycetota bacterium]
MLTCKLNGPCDLLEKLRNDVELLEDEVTSYRFFNLAITGYHIIDWIENNKSIPRAAREAAEKMREDKYISICRDLANASKHFKLRKDYKNRKTDSVESVQGPCGTGRYGKGLCGIGEEQITIECLDGDKYDALEIARAILKTWDDFFKKHKLT